MRLPVKARIERIEQAHTVSVFWTLNVNLWEIVRWGLRKTRVKTRKWDLDKLKSYELLVRLRKPSANHQFSYLYEQLAKRFWEMDGDWFVLKDEYKDKFDKMSSPYTAATFILNEFFEACDDLTRSGEAPFDCIDKKRTQRDREYDKEVKKAIIDKQKEKKWVSTQKKKKLEPEPKKEQKKKEVVIKKKKKKIIKPKPQEEEDPFLAQENAWANNINLENTSMDVPVKKVEKKVQKTKPKKKKENKKKENKKKKKEKKSDVDKIVDEFNTKTWRKPKQKSTSTVVDWIPWFGWRDINKEMKAMERRMYWR